MNVTEVIHLPAPVPVQHAQTPAPGSSSVPARVHQPAQAPAANLSQQAAGTYQVLQGGASFPPSSTPTFVLPPSGRGFVQLFNTIQAIAVEHVYPAPIFSFSA